MKVCGSCGAWIPDDAAACPNCSKGAGGDRSGPPAEGADFYRRRAEGRLRTLGVLYLVAGALTLAFTGLSFLYHATGRAQRAFDELLRHPGPWDPEMLRQARDLTLIPLWLGFTHAVPFLLGCVWVWSGTRLRSLRGRGSALTGAALLLLPVPCSPCCCLLMPLGIYALVTLTRADSETVLAARR